MSKVTLSKDSWHYRNFEAWQVLSKSLRQRDLRTPLAFDGHEWVRSKQFREPDLCTYTRIVILYAPARRFQRWVRQNEWSWFVFFGIVVYAGFVAVGHAEHDDGWMRWLGFPLLATGVLLGFSLVATLIVMLIVGLIEAGHRFKDRRRRWESGDRLLPEYIHAKKSKICPLIEFKDE